MKPAASREAVLLTEFREDFRDWEKADRAVALRVVRDDGSRPAGPLVGRRQTRAAQARAGRLLGAPHHPRAPAGLPGERASSRLPPGSLSLLISRDRLRNLETQLAKGVSRLRSLSPNLTWGAPRARAPPRITTNIGWGRSTGARPEPGRVTADKFLPEMFGFVLELAARDRQRDIAGERRLSSTHRSGILFPRLPGIRPRGKRRSRRRDSRRSGIAPVEDGSGIRWFSPAARVAQAGLLAKEPGARPDPAAKDGATTNARVALHVPLSARQR